MLKQISVFVENKVGALTAATAVLAGEGINLRALSIADTADFGIIRAIADRTEDAAKKLREAGLIVTVTDVIGIRIPDRPGSLHSLLTLLSDAGVAVEYAYAFADDRPGEACLIMKVDALDSAMSILREAGIEKVSLED